MIISSLDEMITYGEQLAKSLTPPLVVELIGDVGTGKTTLVQGIANGLRITEPVTSPSFVINKKYHSPNNLTLSHYDFYRLDDPGIMQEELAESIANPDTITIVEWGESVSGVLPNNRKTIIISYNDDGSRTLEEVK